MTHCVVDKLIGQFRLFIYEQLRGVYKSLVALRGNYSGLAAHLVSDEQKKCLQNFSKK